MQHNIRIDGFAYGLRPVNAKDADFIVELRTRDPARVRYMHPIPADARRQRVWINDYLKRPDDYYWTIERLAASESEGVLGIYDVDHSQKTAEWGRWILRPGSLAAVESALLVYAIAFETLGLKSIYCITVAQNLPVLSFHDSCGLPRVAFLKAQLELCDGVHDAVKHLITRETWQTVRPNLEQQARLVARRLGYEPK